MLHTCRTPTTTASFEFSFRTFNSSWTLQLYTDVRLHFFIFYLFTLSIHVCILFTLVLQVVVVSVKSFTCKLYFVSHYHHHTSPSWLEWMLDICMRIFTNCTFFFSSSPFLLLLVFVNRSRLLLHLLNFKQPKNKFHLLIYTVHCASPNYLRIHFMIVIIISKKGKTFVIKAH